MYFYRLVGAWCTFRAGDPHRCIVQGPVDLTVKMESPDIRAGMALVCRSVRQSNPSSQHRAVDRGYERVDEKLRLLALFLTGKKKVDNTGINK